MVLIFELQKCSAFFDRPCRRLRILIIQCSLITLINHLLFRDVSGLPYFLVTVGTVGSFKKFKKSNGGRTQVNPFVRSEMCALSLRALCRSQMGGEAIPHIPVSFIPFPACDRLTKLSLVILSLKNCCLETKVKCYLEQVNIFASF